MKRTFVSLDKAVKTIDLITARPAQMINKTTEKLSNVLLLGDSTSHSSSISQMFSSLNDFNIDLSSISSSVGRSVQSLNNLSQEINSSNPKFDMAVEHFSELYFPFFTLNILSTERCKRAPFAQWWTRPRCRRERAETLGYEEGVSKRARTHTRNESD
uniref:Uncharacterized protein n=1 Tax=Caenorhabditis japonica TaxID=281687 RepID=A0A8R1ILY1_CAEJA